MADLNHLKKLIRDVEDGFGHNLNLRRGFNILKGGGDEALEASVDQLVQIIDDLKDKIRTNTTETPEPTTPEPTTPDEEEEDTTTPVIEPTTDENILLSYTGATKDDVINQFGEYANKKLYGDIAKDVEDQYDPDLDLDNIDKDSYTV